MEYKFLVNRDVLEMPVVKEPRTGSVDFYQCSFAFSAEWADLVAFAVFRIGEENIGPVVIADGKCRIPQEAAASPGEFEIGIYGTNVQTGMRISTNWVRITVREGAYCDITTAPAIPETTVWETMLKKMYPYIGENENWYIYQPETDTFADSGISARGPQGVQGEVGYTPVRGKDYWTPEDAASIQQEVDRMFAESGYLTLAAAKEQFLMQNEKSGAYVFLQDHAENENFLHCTVTAGPDGLGSQNQDGQYEIQLASVGQNLFCEDDLAGDFTWVSENEFTIKNIVGVAGMTWTYNLPQAEYTMMYELRAPEGANYRFSINYTDGTSRVRFQYTDGTYKTYLLDVPADKQIASISLLYGSQDTTGNTFFRNLRLVRGRYTEETMPAYVPYQGNTAKILLDAPLAAGQSASVDLESQPLSGVENENMVYCKTGGTPEGICVRYYQDTQKVINELKEAIVNGGLENV